MEQSFKRSRKRTVDTGKPACENGGQRILVMGGLGFIGSTLSRLLLRAGYRVRVFDKLYGSRELIKGMEHKIEIVEGDAKKPEDVIAALEDIDVAVDLIHSTVPGTSMQDPVYDAQTNVEAHAGWLSQLNKTGLKRIIYVSSGGTVYGDVLSHPISEDHPTNPICAYGITKLAIEKYVAMFATIHGVDYRVCRPANIYGEKQHLHIGQGVIGVFLEQCLRKQPIGIWGDGSLVRDYLYVEDMARSIVKLIRYHGESRIFNISSGKGYALNDIVEIIREDLNIPVQVNFMGSRAFDVKANVLDNSRLIREIGWRPRIDLVSGIRRVHDYLKKRLEP